MAGDRLRQLAHKIFAIECKFQQFKSRPPSFKEAFAHGCQRGVLSKSVLPLLACLARRRLQLGTDMLFVITSNGYALFNGININDPE